MEATADCSHCPGNKHRDVIIDQTLATVLSTLDMKAVPVLGSLVQDTWSLPKLEG